MLGAIGVLGKALVDLDFAFREAVSSGLLASDDPDLTACLGIIADLAVKGNFEVDAAGLPQNSPLMSAAEAFHVLALDAAAASHISALHDKLLEHQVWLWQHGVFEHHLGLTGKNIASCTRDALRLRKVGCREAVSDFAGVASMLDWAVGPPV